MGLITLNDHLDSFTKSKLIESFKFEKNFDPFYLA